MDQPDKKLSPVEIILEEYKALRAEILLCLERRVTIISYGLTATAVLTAGAIAALTADKPYPLLTGIVFSIMIPATCLYVLSIWYAETRRARRASHYLWETEKKLQLEKSLGRKTLEWESRLRQRSDPEKGLFYNHYGVASIRLTPAKRGFILPQEVSGDKETTAVHGGV